MRYATSLCALAFACSPLARGVEGEIDQYEEKCITRSAERLARASKSDRAQWTKDLETAFPGKVANPTKEDEYDAWFDLLTDKNDEWKKADAPNPQIAELFEKVLQRLELGPVPTITRKEFRKFARHVLMRDQENVPDLTEDADKVFRVLDCNGDGDLDRDELTIFLRDEKVRIDADGNGRISKDEYREYFRRKASAKSETLTAAKNGENPMKQPADNKAPAKVGKNGLPDWFTTLDTDKDGQISLFEWRQDKRAVELFEEMDLDKDGLITRDEYLRYLKLKEIELNQKKREEGK
jgi:Ca2+-binding EF-hand superfamily protein